jgi:hypothetical protein
MSEQAEMPGELIYDHIVQIKQVTEVRRGFGHAAVGRGAEDPKSGKRVARPNPRDL